MAFLLLLLYLSTVLSLRIAPEIPTDFSIQLCSTQRKQKTHAHMQFFPQPVKHCAAIKSSKHKKHLIHELRGSTSHDSKVKISWREVTGARTCRLIFNGYQHEYRLTPDFGAYESCQFSLSRHVYQLSELIANNRSKTESLSFNSTNSKCPIVQVPSTYADYISCSLRENVWYQLQWESSIRYETFFNGTYGTYWANYSTAFLFKPTSELERNGSETDWLKRLITIHSRSNGCQKASVLVRLDDHWPLNVFLSSTYRVIQNHQKIFVQPLSASIVDRWLELEFPLKDVAASHQVCVHMKSELLPQITQRVCREIISSLDCPFPPTSSSSAAFTLPLTLLCSFFSYYILDL